ncbi:hypothetical protein [Nocardia neocaledoniensis]|uniref:hypothetical protein n=1 Tax=Nocardia neocaledoniensis TaxID=236511 RepID=UPI0024575E14|nr:hypothetical protein [Nocardia neocaledoniensis]
MQTIRLAAGSVAALAVLAGVSGCGNDTEDDHSAHATSTTVAAATTTRANLTGTAPLLSPSPTHPPAPEPSPVTTSEAAPVTTTSDVPPVPPPYPEDVNCGPVTDAGGGSRTVIAVGNAAGRPGCTEAITVATTYVTTISPSDAMTVDGWRCHAQQSAETPSVCEKGGLLIALRAG